MLKRIIGLVAATAVVMAWLLVVPGRASAHGDGSEPSPTPLAACTSTLTTPCIPGVTNNSGTYNVDLPGVGTLTFTLDPTSGTITGAAVANLNANFTASTPKVDKDGDKVSVTYTSTTDPSVKYTVVARSSGGANPTVTAFARSGAGCHHDGDGENDGDQDGDHHEGFDQGFSGWSDHR